MNPFAPHPIYRPPKEFLDLYDPETLSPPVFVETDVEHHEACAGVDQQTRHAVDPRIPRELLGDHGLAYKGGRYYEALVHVPRIVSRPAQIAAHARTAGLSVGELYDLRTDPGVTRDLWNDLEHLELQTELLHQAMKAYMRTSDAGIERTRGY